MTDVRWNLRWTTIGGWQNGRELVLRTQGRGSFAETPAARATFYLIYRLVLCTNDNGTASLISKDREYYTAVGPARAPR